VSTYDAANDVHVVIVGGGLAGLCALNAAIDSGARAVLIEKTSALGGSTVLSSGLMAFAGTDEQREAHVEDSAECLRHDLLVTGLEESDPALLDVYASEQYSTYQWLKETGVSFGEPHAGSGQSVPRSHPVDTWHLVDTLARRARARGGRVDLGTAAQRLLIANGGVVGVMTSSATGDESIHAGAVVLASGGFSRNEALLTKVAPAMASALRAGGEGNTGDGLQMASDVGAGLADMEFVKGTFGIFPFRSAAEEGTGILAVYKGAIAVNGYGKRFIDESLPYKVLGDACLAQPAALAYQIFDEQVMEESESSVPIYNFRRRLEAGQVRQSDTLEELADQLGIDEVNLTETVRTYNEALSSGRPDAFRRATLCGGVGSPTPIMKPPFYGFPSTTVVLATYCGVTVDRATRVTDVHGEPIPGLYAAGEVTGGFHGNGYVTGSSLGKSAVFGRIAGARAAHFARGERE
jgi:fumarate reductase flavoprotein subunit